MHEDKDDIYTIEDENGVEFNLAGFKQYGWGSYYQYTDDYNMQSLNGRIQYTDGYLIVMEIIEVMKEKV